MVKYSLVEPQNFFEIFVSTLITLKKCSNPSFLRRQNSNNFFFIISCAQLFEKCIKLWYRPTPSLRNRLLFDLSGCFWFLNLTDLWPESQLKHFRHASTSWVIIFFNSDAKRIQQLMNEESWTKMLCWKIDLNLWLKFSMDCGKSCLYPLELCRENVLSIVSWTIYILAWRKVSRHSVTERDSFVFLYVCLELVC